VTTFARTVHTGILRCTHVLCERFCNYTYATPAEKEAVLAANCEQPWACKPQHERKSS
jgi:hypothetical protein